MEECPKVSLGIGISFIEFCRDDLKITTNSGLKLFTNNVYTNNRFVRDVPFIGQKLYLPPFRFGVKEIIPNEIFINSFVRKEMKIRFDKLSSNVKEVLYNDFLNNKDHNNIRTELKRRENLHAEFIGTVTNNFKRSPKPGHICVCIENVRLRYDYKNLTDHLWIAVPKTLFNDLKIKPGDKIEFYGIIYPYIQFDQINMCSFVDYSIKVINFQKTNL